MSFPASSSAFLMKKSFSSVTGRGGVCLPLLISWMKKRSSDDFTLPLLTRRRKQSKAAKRGRSDSCSARATCANSPYVTAFAKLSTLFSISLCFRAPATACLNTVMRELTENTYVLSRVRRLSITSKTWAALAATGLYFSRPSFSCFSCVAASAASASSSDAVMRMFSVALTRSGPGRTSPSSSPSLAMSSVSSVCSLLCISF
mmetsp:Transcript_16369/g.41524  ORF Transcript_16369/g.41524 Transcript_16369/m.41524 type:complete len:203 (+) Transcript_16369:2501-3109(+)